MELRYKAPSRDIGEKVGLPFLWDDWGFENDHAALQTKYLAGDEALERDLARHIFGRDDRLYATGKFHWVIMGALSQYNFDDIWYFCTVEWFNRDPTFYEAQKALGWGSNGWIMSPETLRLVYQHVKEAA